jgi:RNA polymerase sigma-70 factor, ECF subfamily
MKQDTKNTEFLELFESIRKDLSRFAMALTRNREDAQDLAQETTLKAYESFNKISDKSKFKSYIFTIASRIHKRRIWRARIFTIFEPEKFENLIYRGDSSETKLDVEYLYKSIAKLPAKQAEAIVLFEISGFSLSEIQEIQGGTLSGVKTRLKRGRERLAELMNEDYRFVSLSKDVTESQIINQEIPITLR